MMDHIDLESTSQHASDPEPDTLSYSAVSNSKEHNNIISDEYQEDDFLRPLQSLNEVQVSQNQAGVGALGYR